MIFGIFIGIFLRYLSSDIVIVINGLNMDTSKLQNTEDVIRALEGQPKRERRYSFCGVDHWPHCIT